MYLQRIWLVSKHRTGILNAVRQSLVILPTQECPDNRRRELRPQTDLTPTRVDKGVHPSRQLTPRLSQKQVRFFEDRGIHIAVAINPKHVLQGGLSAAKGQIGVLSDIATYGYLAEGVQNINPGRIELSVFYSTQRFPYNATAFTALSHRARVERRQGNWVVALRLRPGRGKSGLHRTGCWGNPRRGNPTESGTETNRLDLSG